jgi:hypothetical protein
VGYLVALRYVHLELSMNVLSQEVETVLKNHGIPAEPRVIVVDADVAIPILKKLVGDKGLAVAPTVADAVRLARGQRLVAMVSSGEASSGLLRALSAENLTVAVLAVETRQDGGAPAMLRASGVMDVVSEVTEGALAPLLRRALDFSALLTLELAHRCESRRLLNRELELLGQPPESMSDDLSVFQPPPLPVGPLSVYNLEEASEAFETAYIDRVQQLCASAREAAVYLGVSSATLSRRLRKEQTLDGQ